MSGEHRKQKTVELAAQLAPLEEQIQASDSNTQSGVILVKKDYKLPSGLVTEDSDDDGKFAIDKVIIVILAIALIFIAVIAYMISLMPNPK